MILRPPLRRGPNERRQDHQIRAPEIEAAAESGRSSAAEGAYLACRYSRAGPGVGVLPVHRAAEHAISGSSLGQASTSSGHKGSRRPGDPASKSAQSSLPEWVG